MIDVKAQTAVRFVTDAEAAQAAWASVNNYWVNGPEDYDAAEEVYHAAAYQAREAVRQLTGPQLKRVRRACPAVVNYGPHNLLLNTY